MPERITCSCGKVLIVPDTATGSLGICPVCSRQLTLPGSQLIPVGPTAPPPADESIEEMRERLRRALEGWSGETAAPPKRPWRWRRWAVGGVVGIGLLGLSMWLAGTTFWSVVTGITALLLLFGFTAILRENAWRDLGLPYLACLLVWGAWVGLGVLFKPTRVEIQTDYTLKNAENPHVPIRVLYDGDEVLSFTDGKSQTFRRRLYLRHLLGAQALRPEGWTACVLDDREYNLLTVKPGPLVLLYIDNPGPGPVTVACGNVRLHVPANARLTRTILAPTEPGLYPLTVDGQPAGNLTGQYYLVDVRGTRSYRLRTVVYGGILPLMRPVADARLLVGRRLHELPRKIDFFLTPAPDKIKVSRLAGMPGLHEERVELVEGE